MGEPAQLEWHDTDTYTVPRVVALLTAKPCYHLPQLLTNGTFETGLSTEDRTFLLRKKVLHANHEESFRPCPAHWDFRAARRGTTGQSETGRRQNSYVLCRNRRSGMGLCAECYRSHDREAVRRLRKGAHGKRTAPHRHQVSQSLLPGVYR